MLTEYLIAAPFVAAVLLMLARMDRGLEVIGVTIGVHTVVLVTLDIIEVTHELEPYEVAPRVELFEVEIPKPPKPPPPPPVQARTEPPKDTTVKPRTRTIPQPQLRPPPPTTAVTNQDAPAQESDSAPTVAMPELGKMEGTVAVRVGKRNTGQVGAGNKGKNPGTGSGSGSAEAPPPTPVSVATIKTRAMPKGDYGYIDAGRDYPAEARQLGIEGPIRVRLIVDDKGKVKAAVLLNKLGHGLDELALDRSKKIEFEPAKDTDDKPVSSVVVWTFNMTLPK